MYTHSVEIKCGGASCSPKRLNTRDLPSAATGNGNYILVDARARARVCEEDPAAGGGAHIYLWGEFHSSPRFPAATSRRIRFYLLFTCSLSSWNRTIVIEWLRFSFTLPIPPRFFFSQRRSSLEIRILSLQTKRHGFDRDSILSPPFVNRCIEGGRIDR